MKLRTLVATLSIGLITVLAAGWPSAASAVEESISKVNGRIEVDAGTTAGSLKTVNGSINVGPNARSGNASTVNGSINLRDGARAGQLSTVNGSIHGGLNVHADDVSTVNGQIFMDRGSQIGGNVSTVNGAIGLVGTQVAGDIEITNGDLTVGANSHLIGGIHYRKPAKQWFSVRSKVPRIVIGPDAQVDGAMVFERDVRLYVHESARIGELRGASAETYTGARPPMRE